MTAIRATVGDKFCTVSVGVGIPLKLEFIVMSDNLTLYLNESPILKIKPAGEFALFTNTDKVTVVPDKIVDKVCDNPKAKVPAKVQVTS